MKRIRTIAALIGAAAIGLPLLASGQQQPDIGKEMDVGKREYDANCALCHGPKGKGDGPNAGAGERRPADLTTLAQRNGGWFPIARVYEVIDGRRLVKAHTAAARCRSGASATGPKPSSTTRRRQPMPKRTCGSASSR